MGTARGLPPGRRGSVRLTRTPGQVQARGLAAHLLYGAVTDLALDALDRATGKAAERGAAMAEV